MAANAENAESQDMVQRLRDNKLLVVEQPHIDRAVAGLSEEEFQVLADIKRRLDEAIGGPENHSPRDGAIFW